MSCLYIKWLLECDLLDERCFSFDHRPCHVPGSCTVFLETWQGYCSFQIYNTKIIFSPTNSYSKPWSSHCPLHINNPCYHRVYHPLVLMMCWNHILVVKEKLTPKNRVWTQHSCLQTQDLLHPGTFYYKSLINLILVCTELIVCIISHIVYIGPGEYDPDLTSRIGSKQSGLACSREERFKTSPRSTLGPGSYQVRSGWILLLLVMLLQNSLKRFSC